MREREVYRADTFAALPTTGVKNLDIGIVGNNLYEYRDGDWANTDVGGAGLVAFNNASDFDAYWAGAGTTNAPSTADYWQGALGVNNDGASTANIYRIVEVSGTLTWVDTGATVANFFGA